MRTIRVCFRSRAILRLSRFIFLQFRVIERIIKRENSETPRCNVYVRIIITGLLSRNKSKDESKRFVLVLVDIAALAAQATSFVLWPLLENSKHSLWLIPVALFLVSCGWWENYVSTQSRIGKVFLGSRQEKI